ncbi:hypothetical protein LC085_16815 [Bacillus tianshenii]|uniref:hypothetical protein n=1 Tax=Sutcliffiella tianshenii TaxID=1463404 RepID=UPI001CD36085|nr:hypothetical protein [Bacillus tianshenii]MCA1321569.1 hypothetical protein [Bacillus tianshenii]
MKTINQYFILRELKGISDMTRYLVKEKDGMQLFMLRMIDERQEADLDKWFELYDHYQLQVTNYKHLPKLQQIDGYEGTKAYAVLECPVGNRLKTVGSLTKAQVEQLIDAVGHLHKKNIAHGSINAENVWISKSGNITLFGAQEAEALPTGPVSPHIQADTGQMVALLTEYAPVDASRLTGCKTIGELQERLFFSSAKPGLVEKEMLVPRKAPEPVVEQKPVAEKRPVAEKKTNQNAEPKPREASPRPQPVILEQSYRQDVWPDSTHDQTREARNEQRSSKMMKFMMVVCAMIFLIWVGTQIGDDNDRSALVYEEESPETLVESVEEEAPIYEEEEAEEEPEQYEEPEMALPEGYLATYSGFWGDPNSFQEGGLELELEEIDAQTAYIQLHSIQAPPANRVASIEYTVTFDEYGEGRFTFEDDGWGSSGEGLISLMDMNMIMVTIEYDYQHPDAMWMVYDGTASFLRGSFFMDGLDEWGMATYDEPTYDEYEEDVEPDSYSEDTYEEEYNYEDTYGSYEASDEWYNGYGEENFDDGSYYRGDYQDGLFHGDGEFTWATGEYYIGQYYEGQMDGYGTYIWPDGTIYEGEWQSDMMHGYGTMTWPDGTQYQGTFDYGDFTEDGEWIYP